MNMKKKRKTDALIVLLLFGVFAICILAVLLTGADSYQRLSRRDQAGYDSRTAAQYLTTRVRQADRLGDVTVEDFGGADALVFTEEFDGVAYSTRVYCHDGYLRELFASAEETFLPEDGEKILQAQDLTLTLSGQTLQAKLTDSDGEVQQLTLYLRSREGAAS